MKKLKIFDPAMCCSTGICGVDVDPVLVQFAADLKWLETQGVGVQRYNLGQEPQAFAANVQVVKAMETGMSCLPLLLLDDVVVSTGQYPTRQQLVAMLDMTVEEAIPATASSDNGNCGCTSSCC